MSKICQITGKKPRLETMFLIQSTAQSVALM